MITVKKENQEGYLALNPEGKFEFTKYITLLYILNFFMLTIIQNEKIVLFYSKVEKDSLPLPQII